MEPPINKGKVVVALWSRPVECKYSSTVLTLDYLGDCLKKTRLFAKSQGIKPEAGTISTIFVAPEFLFTNPTFANDHKATSHGMDREKRDYVLDRLKKYSASFPGMLLVPGTLVFRDDPRIKYEDARHENVKREKIGKTFGELAIQNLMNAADPAKQKVKKTHNTLEADSLRRRKLVTTGDEQTDKEQTASDGSKKLYTDQVATLRYPQLTPKEKQDAIFHGRVDTPLIKNRTYVLMDGERMVTYGKKCNQDDFHEGPDAEVVFVPGKKEGIKEIGKKKIGFEICYDHEQGTLKTYVDDLDLQIILSARVPGQDDKFAVRPGGHVIHASSNPLFSGVAKRRQRSSSAPPQKRPAFESKAEVGSEQYKQDFEKFKVDDARAAHGGREPFRTIRDWGPDKKDQSKLDTREGAEYDQESNRVMDSWVKLSEASMNFEDVKPAYPDQDVDGGPLRLYVIDLDERQAIAKPQGGKAAKLPRLPTGRPPPPPSPQSVGKAEEQPQPVAKPD